MAFKPTLRTQLLLVVILPLLVVGITSLASIFALEDTNFEQILHTKHDYYANTLDSIIHSKGDFLSFSATLIRQNKPLIQSLKNGDAATIANHTDNLWNQVSDGIQVLFFWRQEESQGKILYAMGEMGAGLDDFSVPLLEQVAREKRAAFGVETFPDGQVRLMQVSPYFNAPGKPYNLVVQGIDFDQVLKKFSTIVGVDNVVLEVWKDGEKGQSGHYHLREHHLAEYHYPLTNAAGHPIAQVTVTENLSVLYKAFEKSERITFLTLSGQILLSLILIYRFLIWLGRRTGSILDMLHWISQGRALDHGQTVANPDELQRIDQGIRALSQTIEESRERLTRAKEAAEREVVERKQAQSDLQALSQQNKLLLEGAGEGIYGIDLEGHTTFINPAGAKMVGWEPEELIGKPQHALLHHTRPDGTPYPAEACPVHAASQDGQVHFKDNELFWRRDGTSFAVEYTSTPIREGDEIKGAVVVFRDITRRSENEKRTQRSITFQMVLNAIYQISFQDIPLEYQLGRALGKVLTIPWLFVQSKGAIFLVDEDSRELRLVAQKGLPDALLTQCARLPFGHCLCGRAALERRVIHAAHVDDRHDTTFPDMAPHGHYVVPLVTGQRLIGVLTLYLEDGHIREPEEEDLLKAVGNSIASLIERGRAEENMRTLNVSLEERVQERTLELQEYVESLKEAQDQLVRSERMAALGGLVAGISHEIKTPVGISYTSATHLETETKRFLDKLQEGTLARADLVVYLDEVEGASELIINNLKRAAELIQSFKAVAVDQTSQEKRTFDLGLYLDEILLSLRPELKKSDHKVAVICPEGVEVKNYPGALSQIVTNLIMNSLDHGFDGKESGEICLEAVSDNGTISLSYTDNGQGMDANTLKRMYEPFFTTNRNKGGSGLGMHIVFNLVTQRLNGTLHCDSGPGEGVRFLIQFPKQV
ncbi:MAG: PAS domain-containing protein [Magnetococcales bacterium]|nr:PAS domain-containing protein [Magnetococcales bacterium]